MMSARLIALGILSSIGIAILIQRVLLDHQSSNQVLEQDESSVHSQYDDPGLGIHREEVPAEDEDGAQKYPSINEFLDTVNSILADGALDEAIRFQERVRREEQSRGMGLPFEPALRALGEHSIVPLPEPDFLATLPYVGMCSAREVLGRQAGSLQLTRNESYDNEALRQHRIADMRRAPIAWPPEALVGVLSGGTCDLTHPANQDFIKRLAFIREQAVYEYSLEDEKIWTLKPILQNAARRIGATPTEELFEAYAPYADSKARLDLIEEDYVRRIAYELSLTDSIMFPDTHIVDSE